MKDNNIEKIIAEMIKTIKESFEEYSRLGEAKTQEYNEEMMKYKEEMLRLQGGYKALEKLSRVIIEVGV